MRLLDRIAVTRAIQTLLDFIIEIVKIFTKKNNIDKPDGPVKPKPRRRPLRDWINNVNPWRNDE